MPEPLIVPGFNNVAEFDAWVAGLNEADIQAWTSKDWVKMYEQLDKLGVEAANIPESLNKLYTNFRFELADYNNIVKIGQNIGEKMAEGKINIANKTVPNPNYPLNMMDYAQTMDYITWSETNYGNSGTPLGDYSKSGSTIMIDNLPERVQGEAYPNGLTKITSNQAYYSSELASAPIHEALHQWFQLHRDDQLEAFKQLGIKPSEVFSDDFMKMLEYNNKYYLRGENLFGKDSKGFSRQPVEKFSQIGAKTADRHFRMLTGQGSEYAAQTFATFLSGAEEIRYSPEGTTEYWPDGRMKRTTNKIDFIYRTEKETIESALGFLDEEVRKTIDVAYDAEKGICTVSVPRGFDFQGKLANAIENSGVYFLDGGKTLMIEDNGSPYWNVDWEKVKNGKFETVALADVYYIPENMDLSNYSCAYFKNTNINNEINLPKSVIVENSTIQTGANLSNVNELNVYGKLKTGQNIVLPNNVILNDATVVAGTDFSSAKELTVHGNLKAGEGVIYSNNVILDNTIISAGTNLSSVENLTVQNSLIVEENSILPQNVKIKSSEGDWYTFKGNIKNIPEAFSSNLILEDASISNIDLSRAEGLCVRGGLVVGENTRLPQDITLISGEGDSYIFSGKVNNIPKAFDRDIILESAKLSNMDLRGIDNLMVSGELVITGDNVLLPENANFRSCTKLTLENVQSIPENLRLPEMEIVASETCYQTVREQVFMHNKAIREGEFGNRVDFRQTLSKGKEIVEQRVEKASQLVLQAYKESREEVIKLAKEFAETKAGKSIMSMLRSKGFKYGSEALYLAALAYGLAQTNEYAKNEDWIGAGLSGLSTIALAIPEGGWVVSLAIDAAVLPAYEEYKRIDAEYNASHKTVYNSPEEAKEIEKQQAQVMAKNYEYAKTGQVIIGDVTTGLTADYRERPIYKQSQHVIDLDKQREEFQRECDEVAWQALDYQLSKELFPTVNGKPITVVSGLAKQKQEEYRKQQIDATNNITRSSDPSTRINSGATVPADNIMVVPNRPPELPVSDKKGEPTNTSLPGNLRLYDNKGNPIPTAQEQEAAQEAEFRKKGKDAAARCRDQQAKRNKQASQRNNPSQTSVTRNRINSGATVPADNTRRVSNRPPETPDYIKKGKKGNTPLPGNLTLRQGR